MRSPRGTVDSLSNIRNAYRLPLTAQDDLNVCARMAVTRGDAVYNSFIFENEVKSGAYSVTLHLYRRALAGAIARGLSLHKRSRLHFVRGSRNEAARVAEEAKNHFETGGCSSSDGFSARHSNREYGNYEQLRGFIEVDLNGTTCTSNSLWRSLLCLSALLPSLLLV